MSALSVIFPAYIYPTSTAWAPLTSCIAQNPSNTFNVIINPANGPGSTSYPNSDYVTAIANLNSYSNVNTYGYVDTLYATRLSTSVMNDVNAYAGWSNYSGADIHMDGIFFDRSPQLATAISTPFLTTVTQAARNENMMVYLNPGGAMDSSFYALANHVNAIEVPGIVYVSSIAAAVPAANRASSSAIIYAFAGTATDQSQVIGNLANAGYGGVYVSSDPSFQSFGGLWTSFCGALSGNSTSSSSSSSSSATSSTASSASAVASSSTKSIASSSASSSAASSSSTASSAAAVAATSSAAAAASTTSSASTKATTTTSATTLSTSTTKAGINLGIVTIL